MPLIKIEKCLIIIHSVRWKQASSTNVETILGMTYGSQREEINLRSE